MAYNFPLNCGLALSKARKESIIVVAQRANMVIF